MGTPETSREPCPDRILDDLGGAFGMGAVGGTQAVRMNAPRVGGSFAVWGGLFSTFDCTMVYVRQKEDLWNSIIASAATGGFLSMRQGLGAASRSALVGGVLLALIEGAGIMLNKFLSQPQMPIMIEEPAPNVAGMPGFPMGQLPNQAPALIDSSMQGSPESSSSWFGGVFGGGKKQEPAAGNGSKTEVLESFDAPAVPSFEYK
ncbi:hypothetical protein V6Z11_A13G218900 [Gossypium hirsutum]